MAWAPPQDERIDSGWKPPEGERVESTGTAPAISTGNALAPEQAANVFQLSEWSGFAPAFVERNVPDLEAKKREDGFRIDDLKNSAPKTAAWATENPYNAALTSDDIHNLAKAEESLRDYGGITGMLKGFFQTGLLNLAKMGVQAPGGAIEGSIGAARLAGKIDESKAGILPRIATSLNPFTDVGYGTLARAGKYLEENDIDLKAPDWMLKNRVTEWLDEKSKNTAPWELSESVIEEAKKGNYTRAGRILAVKAAANFPTSIAILAANAFGGPLGAGATLGAMGAGEAGETAISAREQGVDVGSSQIAAFGHGVAEAGGEYIGTFGAIKGWEKALTANFGKEVSRKVLFDFFKTVTYSGLAEGNEELWTSVSQDLTDYFTGVNPNALEGMGSRALESFVVGAASGVGGTSPVASLTTMASMNAQKRTALARDFYMSLGDSLEATKLRERLPGKMREFAERITKDSPVENIFVPVEAVETYFQGAKQDPVQFMQTIGALEAYTEAKEHGGPVKIPTAVWAEKVVGTEHYAALKDDVKFSLNDMTVNEAKAFSEEMQKEAETRKPEMESAGKVYDDFRTKLVSAGFEASEADAHAILMAERARRRGQILGEDAFELYQKENIQVQRPGEVQPAQAAQAPMAQSATTTEQPSAVFVGWQDQGKFGPPFPLYNITGNHPRSGSTVGAETLQELGLQVPETPAFEEWQTEPKTFFQASTAGAKRSKVEDAAREWQKKGTDSKYFKRWFGDSKVVDENAKPLVVYHGTSAKIEGFEKQFNGGYFFSARPELASDFAAFREYTAYFEEERGNVVPAYLSIKNPLEVNAHGGFLTDIEDNVIQQANLNGNDGIVIRNAKFDTGVHYTEEGINARDYETKTPDEYKSRGLDTAYIVFTPNQIKSATGNVGTFNPENPSILQQAQQGENPRAQIRFGQNVINIDLFKKADLSSLLHEMWHVFAREMGQDYAAVQAKDPAALNAEQRQFIQDADALLKWVGAESFDKLTTEQHEQIARAGEAYFREGRAPSEALKGAFARFREWLLMVYRTIRGLNVELAPEVREVFDRMLASQEEIAAARAEMGTAPLFSDAKMVGMTDTQAERYAKALNDAKLSAEEELATKVMGEMKRKQMSDYLVKRNKIKEEVEAEVNARKEYIALAILQRGALPSGERAPEGLQETKLSRKAIVETYGEEHLAKLPRPYVYSRENGIHPDEAAAIFGFKDGLELLTALENAKPKAQLVEEIVEARMRAEYGDMIGDGTIAHEAMKAVHNEKRAQLLKLEMDHLVEGSFPAFKDTVRRVARPVPSVDAVRKQAREAIAKKSPRDIFPAMYQRTESQAAKAAVEAMLKGDLDGAFNAKLRERLNHELYRAAMEARERIDKMVDYFKKFDDTAVRERIGKAGGTYLDQIDGLLERFDFRKSVTLKELDRRKSLVEWVAEQKAAGFDVSIAPELLNEANRRHYKDTPFETLTAMDETVKTIEHMATFKNKLLANERARTVEEAAQDIVGTLTANHEIKPQPVNRFETIESSVKGFVAEVAASHVKMERFFQWLDGQDQGAMYRHFWEPFLKGKHFKSSRQAESAKAMREIFKTYKKSEWAAALVKPIYIPEIGGKLTKANILAVALNQGNEYNREALMEGEGWIPQQVQAILSHMDKRDWDTVQAIWDHINSYWPEVEALEKRINGVAPEKVQASEIVTKFGVYRGGYYPIAWDVKRSIKAGMWSEGEQVQDLFGGQWARAMTRHGHTISRDDTGGKPLSLSLSVIPGHIEQVIHDLAYREAVIDVMRLAENEEIQNAIIGVAGQEYYKQIKPWVRSIAGDRVQPQVRWMEKLVSHARTGATIVNLGLRVTSALAQVNGYTNTFHEIGPKYAALGLKHIGQDGLNFKKLWEFISSKSPEMAARLTNFDRDARDAMRKIGVSGLAPGVLGAMDIYTQDVKEAFFWLTGFMDLATSVPTWLGAYQKALDGNVKGVDPKDEAGAVAYADSVVRLTQSAGDVMDLAAVQRGGELMKAFTMFYSQLSIQFNQFWKLQKDFRGDRNIPRLVSGALFLWFIPKILEELIRGRGPDDDEKWLSWMVKESLTYPLETIVFARDIVSGLQRFGYEPSPAFEAYELLTKTLKIVGKEDELSRGDIKNIVNTVGYFAHLPTRQTYQTLEYIYDWMTGEQTPESPAEGIWRALVIGKKRE